MRQGGNEWSGWVSYLSFFRHVARLDLPIYEKWQHYEALAVHGGPRYVHRRFWIVSDFPEVLRVEERVLHSVTGPAKRWRDGWSIYSVRGVRVPARWIEERDRVEIEERYCAIAARRLAQEVLQLGAL